MLGRKTVAGVMHVFTKAINDLQHLHDVNREEANKLNQKALNLRAESVSIDNEADRAIRLKFRLEELLEA